MAAKLVAEEGALKGLVLSLEDSDQWVIGRDPDACQLLVEDPSASRKHLVCRTTPEGIQVENLSTTNPIQVNDEEVKEPRLLQNGDVVKIGTGLFRFYAEAAAQLIKDAAQQETSTTPATNGHAPNSSAEESAESKKEEPEPAIETNDTPPAEENIPKEEAAKENENLGELTENQEPEEIKKEESATEKPEETPVEAEVETPIEDEKKTGVAEAGAEAPVEAEIKPADAKEEPGQTPADAENQPAEINEETKPEQNESPPMTATAPQQTSNSIPDDEDDQRHDSIYEDEGGDKNALAEINFGLLDTGRWLLKVIGGPNNGAEFSMQSGMSYIIGTDPNVCDIVFHDTSVSRQHARITIGQDETLTIEDLKSRNGTVVDGEPLKGKRTLAANTLISLGTTSFVVFDREGEMQTIISPLMPSIVKVLQTEEKKPEEAADNANAAAPVAAGPVAPTPEAPVVEPLPPHHHTTTLGAFILIGILTGLFVIIGIGTTTLFKSEPVAITQTIDPVKALDDALSPFPSVKYTFNKNTGQLLLVGHVMTSTDKSQLLYALQGLKFIKSLDDSGLVIDEYVWRETNQILEKNPDWKGISIISPTPGHFVVTGYLQTRAQADRLSEYLSANFQYPDLLEKRIIVDEEVLATINNLIHNKGFTSVVAKLDNGELTLSGAIPQNKAQEIDPLLAQIKDVRGVRTIRNLTTVLAPEQSIINISDKYDVTGVSVQGKNLTVVINGRILMKGDALDGMTITSIQPSTIFLEKEGSKYRIDYNR